MDVALKKDGNSVGVFVNGGGFESLVLRLEAPVASLFGLKVSGSQPTIHFQYVKGSEINRRRESNLRTSATDEENWVPVSCYCIVDRLSIPGRLNQTCHLLLATELHPLS